MSHFVSSCPVCSGVMVVARLSCPGCGTQVEGAIELPVLLQLSADDIEFITRFVKSSGSLKAVAALEGVSYPTVRNRLNELIARIERAEDSRRAQPHQHQVLDALERGELSVAAAVQMLRKGKVTP